MTVLDLLLLVLIVVGVTAVGAVFGGAVAGMIGISLAAAWAIKYTMSHGL